MSWYVCRLYRIQNTNMTIYAYFVMVENIDKILCHIKFVSDIWPHSI